LYKQVEKFGQSYCVCLILKESKRDLPLDVPWEGE